VDPWRRRWAAKAKKKPTLIGRARRASFAEANVASANFRFLKQNPIQTSRHNPAWRGPASPASSVPHSLLRQIWVETRVSRQGLQNARAMEISCIMDGCDSRWLPRLGGGGARIVQSRSTDDQIKRGTPVFHGSKKEQSCRLDMGVLASQ